MNTGLISIGTGGTGGHSTLLRKIIPSLSQYGKTYLISEYDCNANNNEIVEYISLTKREHQESVAGKLVHKSYSEIINTLKEKNINHIIWSTFFDERVLEYAKNANIKSTLITYPIRDSFAEYFLLHGFDKKFDNVIVLNDIAGTEIYSKKSNITVSAYIPEITPSEKRAKIIMIQCGGGGRPSSNTFHEKMNALLKICEEELSQYHFFVSTGLYGKDIYKSTKNSTVKNWIDNWKEKASKSTAVISEAGYFAVHELIYSKTPAILIPGARRIDNQELRAVKYAANGMGQCVMPQQGIESLFEAVKKSITEGIRKESEENCTKYIEENNLLPSLESVLKKIMVNLN